MDVWLLAFKPERHALWWQKPEFQIKLNHSQSIETFSSLLARTENVCVWSTQTHTTQYRDRAP